MKSNLYNKSFLSVISILIISSSVIFPQHGKDRIGVTRPPVKSNPSIAVEQRKPSYNPPTSTTPRTPEPKQVQRPVVDNPAPRIEQKKQIINETPQRNYEPRIIERQPETKVNNFTDRKKQVVIEPGPRESVIKQPVREEKRPTPPTVLHNPPEVINQPMIEYTEPNCDPPRRPNRTPISLPPPSI